MQPTARAKICGLTTAEALDAALHGGAAYVGAVIFPPSPRHIAPDAAAALFAPARGRAEIVAVTVEADDALLAEIARTLRPDLIQLHGRESPERAGEVRRLTGARIIKALPISGACDLDGVDAWTSVADFVMLDARPPAGSGLPGGVGARFDWSMLSGRRFERPWFLAGGLDPTNVAKAMMVTGAPLVDVSSGVERAPGAKDPALIAAFLAAAAAPATQRPTP